MQLVFSFFAVCALIATTVSVVTARHYLKRRRRPSFSISIAVTAFTLVLMLGLGFQGDLLHWRHWIEWGAKSPPLRLLVPIWGVCLFPFAAVPAVLVVCYYRKKFRHDNVAV